MKTIVNYFKARWTKPIESGYFIYYWLGLNPQTRVIIARSLIILSYLVLLFSGKFIGIIIWEGFLFLTFFLFLRHQRKHEQARN